MSSGGAFPSVPAAAWELLVSFAMFPRALLLTFRSERVALDRGGDARPWETWMRGDEVKKKFI